MKKLGLRRTLILLTFIGILITMLMPRLPWYAPHAQPCSRCNLVLVSIDSLRRDHMGLYGYRRNTTPSIDAWARDGWIFDNYFSTSYLTPTSEGSVHTGLFPQTNGIVNFQRYFAADIKTLAEIAKENGYRTAAIGTSPEFEHYDSLKASFSRGFDKYFVKAERITNRRILPWDAVREFFDDASDKPFFLWISLGEAHAPFGIQEMQRFTRPRYSGPFSNLVFFGNLQFYFEGLLYDMFDAKKNFTVVGWHGGEKRPLHGVKEELRAKYQWPIPITSEDLAYLFDQYDNGVATADSEFEGILDLLKSHGVEQNTVVILQSEHGETLGERGYIAHYDIWEESTHEPLIIKSPGFSRPDRSRQLVSGVDLLPTISEHLKFNTSMIRYPLDGKNIIDEKTGHLRSTRDSVYFSRTPLWESVLNTDDPDSPFGRFRDSDREAGFMDHGIRDKRFKLLHRTARATEEQYSCWTYISGKKISRPEFEFYDLRQDPGEKSPLKLDSAEFKFLKEKLLAAESDLRSRARKTPQSELLHDYR